MNTYDWLAGLGAVALAYVILALAVDEACRAARRGGSVQPPKPESLPGSRFYPERDR